MSPIRTAGCQPFGSRPRFDLRPREAVRRIRLATCAAALASPMLPSHRARTREMSIRRASPLGQYSALPAGAEGLATSSLRADDPPDPRSLAVPSLPRRPASEFSQVMSRGMGPSIERPLPRVVRVAYPLDLTADARGAARMACVSMPDKMTARTDGTSGSVDTAGGAPIDPYRKSRLSIILPSASA